MTDVRIFLATSHRTKKKINFFSVSAKCKFLYKEKLHFADTVFFFLQNLIPNRLRPQLIADYLPYGLCQVLQYSPGLLQTQVESRQRACRGGLDSKRIEAVGKNSNSFRVLEMHTPFIKKLHFEDTKFFFYKTSYQNDVTDKSDLLHSYVRYSHTPWPAAILDRAARQARQRQADYFAWPRGCPHFDTQDVNQHSRKWVYCV